MARNKGLRVPWAKGRIEQIFCNHEPEWYTARGGRFFEQNGMQSLKICKKCGKVLDSTFVRKFSR
uniref:Uncharacterized protein n=1 Tax=uncultured bacterium Contig643 TaxID=1393602 RepID=W0FH74_9BACT|nr:hypothetical protein [uncultured bacterium Contig643]